MKLLKNILLFSAAAIAAACGSGGSDGGNTPAAAVLAYPLNNSECETGQSVSATHSRISFEWNAAANADTYSVYVRNLLTQAVLQYQAGNATSLDIDLAKGTPFSWYVASRKEGNSQPTNSATWKFYNAGEGLTDYVPFPADAIAPPMSATVSGPAVILKWETDDIDGNISEYKVYFGTASNPSVLIATTTATEISNVAVNPGTAYYWKVVTGDADGNSSESPVFQFRTN